VTRLKITNSEIIKSGERELIDTITGDLDWRIIEQIVRDRHNLSIKDDIEYKQGDIIVHENKVAYRLDFDVKMTLSIIFDRDGNCLSLATNADAPNVLKTPDTQREPFPSQSPPNPDQVPSPNLFEELPEKEVYTDEDDVPIGGSGLHRAFFDNPPDIKPDKNPQENISRIASHIADMISEINETNGG
jgi:hypothetical protein